MSIQREAETSWFHIFKAMIGSGDLARMGATAFAVYAVIKAHSHFRTGKSFPDIDTIARKAGISGRQVRRELTVLEQHGYLTKAKDGRHNVYTLREKVHIVDGEGRPTEVATWDYLPAAVKSSVAELKNYLQTGRHSGQIIHIEHLYLQFNQGGTNTQLNLDDVNDPDLRKRLEEILKHRDRKKLR
jgi:DNA-binding transcriptional ArsR family regulator